VQRDRVLDNGDWHPLGVALTVAVWSQWLTLSLEDEIVVVVFYVAVFVATAHRDELLVVGIRVLYSEDSSLLHDDDDGDSEKAKL
jgi:hypothetical protein